MACAGPAANDAAATTTDGTLPFGPRLRIPASHTFAASAHSFAFVNLKPVVPGHVLVSSKRVVPRLAGLTPDETADLFTLAARVAAVLEPHYCAGATTLAVQDGALAGQTVPHVHVHILPRRAGDFARNDDIYGELEKDRGPPVAATAAAAPEQAEHLNPDAPRAPPRSSEDMAAEAAVLRALF
jgi:bis(5'-adenosyl)-triphosphatase